MKYMKREFKEELYIEIKKIRSSIKSMLEDERIGDTQTADGYVKLLNEADDKLAELSGYISDYVYHIVV